MSETLDLIMHIAGAVGAITLVGTGYSLVLLHRCHKILVELKQPS